ncbi:hypothetical protein [Thiocystis violacea]|uniref:hypothetical protein n=1 Tax=Thiocystis violacea TaxID=13725 RepID=UPI001907CCD7|nr:hypothetical protein [Thiocystis violacea]MBK1717074.1 hypothetical protein [Thiocystis violacea]
MNVVPLFGLLLTGAGWMLTLMTATAMLSGSYEARTCQTECVQTLFFSGMAAGLLGLLLGLIAIRMSTGRALSQVVLWLAVPLCAIFAAIFLIGTLA